jgi:hypothetical protein
MKKLKTKFEDLLIVFLSVLAINAVIKSIFDNDSSKIVSDEGQKSLNDKKLLARINEKIKTNYQKGESQSPFEYSEVLIDLDKMK